MVSVIIDPETGDPVEVDASAMPECPWASVVSPESWLPGSSWPPLHHSIAVSPLAADRCQVRPSIFLSPPSRAPPRRPC